MKNANEFMAELIAYFGGVPNETVAKDIATEVSYVAPADLPRLMRQIKIQLPASFRPDLKTIVEAIRLSGVETLLEPGKDRICPVCKTRWYSSGVCPKCKYAGPEDGTPEEYRTWLRDRKEGRAPVFDVSEILRTLAQNVNAGTPGGRP